MGRARERCMVSHKPWLRVTVSERERVCVCVSMCVRCVKVCERDNGT